MKQQDITTGFQQVDNSQTSFLVNFLAEIHQFPSVQENFRAQLNWLEIKPGDRILDIGCGIGDQAAEMAGKVGTRGEVVGTDLSETMIHVSRQRHASSALPLSFLQAPATEQPFPNDAFDKVRMERVLLFVHDLDKAFLEFRRVLKHGGSLLIFEFDMDAMAISHKNRALTRKIVDFCSDSFPNGNIGADLLFYFKTTGFTDLRIKCAGYYLPLHFFTMAMGGIIQTGIEKGMFTETEINEWWGHLREQDEKGAFWGSVNGVIIMGTK